MKVSIEIPDSFVEIAKEKGLKESRIKPAFVDYVKHLCANYFYEYDDDGWAVFIEDYL